MNVENIAALVVRCGVPCVSTDILGDRSRHGPFLSGKDAAYVLFPLPNPLRPSFHMCLHIYSCTHVSYTGLFWAKLYSTLDSVKWFHPSVISKPFFVPLSWRCDWVSDYCCPTFGAEAFDRGSGSSFLWLSGQEYDGSDSGARPDEAVSWGKIKLDANPVKVSQGAVAQQMLPRTPLVDAAGTRTGSLSVAFCFSPPPRLLQS